MRKRLARQLLIPAVAGVVTIACNDGAELGLTAVAQAQTLAGASTKPTIVLVHGAFADASGWAEVIARLQQQGFRVVAVQNPLTSLANDVATTRRLIDAQTGDVVAVGHSYGGAVISGASAGSAKVKALVFIAAFAPDANEPLGAVGAQFAPPPLASAIVPDAAGFVYIDTPKFRDVFAGDVPEHQTRIMAVTQKPLFGHIFAEANPDAGWRSIPSWFLVATQDRAINPEAERYYAKRMNARTREIDSSHAVFLSRTEAVVKMIVEAATSATER
jgi:pimeloyl-ACP methyl ester carboxylesterase